MWNLKLCVTSLYNRTFIPQASRNMTQARPGIALFFFSTLFFFTLFFFVLVALSPTHAQTVEFNTQIDAGYQQLAVGELKGAKRSFERALKLDPSSTTALFGLAEVDIAAFEWPAAKSRLDELLTTSPDFLHARYLRGIASREIAKFHTLNQEKYWRESESDFNFILSRDSSYKDVLSQYALWFRYQEKFREAIRYGHEQIHVKPDSTALQFQLIRLYQYLLRYENSAETEKWLAARSAPQDLYFAGEVLRQQGKLIEADDIFSDLVYKKADIFPQLPLLSRARIYYHRNLEKVAQSYVDKAIQSIDNYTEARLVLDDIKHIITDPELNLFNSLSSKEEYKAFFEAFWSKRDPMPARPVNVRMTEHYRRLLYAEQEFAYNGFRLWHNNPDRLGALHFPDSYKLNEEFNDKGLIYIRHGEPYDKEIQIGGDLEYRSVIDNTNPYGSPVEHSTNQGWQPNESWRYNTPERMDFHFVLSSGGKNAWRLIPSLTNIDILISREHWGPLYSELAAAARGLSAISQLANPGPTIGDMTIVSLDEEAQGEFAGAQDSLISTSTSSRAVDMGYMSANSRKFLEFSSLERDMVDQSTEDIELALSTDQHTWAEEIKSIPMPYQIATFRGPNDSTRIDIYFALPIGQITRRLEDERETLEIEMGYAFHDTSWVQILRYAEAKRLKTHPDEAAAIIDFFSFSAPADTFNVSLFSNPLQTHQQSGFKFPFRVPRYVRNELALSDLLMADFIGPAKSGSRFDRGEYHISPNPFHRFSTSQPVFVYFEIYNLVYGNNDRSQFSVEYILRSKNKPRLGLFKRKDRPVLTLQTDRDANDRSPVETAEIDVSEVDPGNYLLTIRVTDRNTGVSVEKSREIELYE